MARIRKRQWGLLLLGTVCTIFVFYSLQKRQANENNRHTINGKNEIVFSAPQCQLSEEEIAELPYTQWRDYLLRTLNADLNDTLLKYLPQELSLDRAEKSKLLALDVGAGAGNVTRFLLKRDWAVTALDIDAASIKIIENCAKKLGIDQSLKTVHSAVEKANLPQKHFDLLHASLVFPFVPQKDFPQTWKKLASTLKPGAYFTGDFFGPKHEWRKKVDGSVDESMSFYTEEEVRKLMDENDLKIIDLENFFGERVLGSDRVKEFHRIRVVAQKETL